MIAHKNVRALIKNKLIAEENAALEKKIIKEIEDLEKSGENSGKAKELKSNYKSRLIDRVENIEVDHEALPAISFDNDLLFHYNDEDVQLIHLPNAHTDSDIVVYFPKSNVLHTGDAFVNGMYPFIDSKNGGSYKGYLNGLKTIEKLCDKDTKIIPGHGELASVPDVKVLSQILNSYYTKIKNAYLQNKTEDQVAVMRDFTNIYDNRGFGEGFITTEKILRTLYKLSLIHI